MRNRCGVRTSSVKAMERETPNDMNNSAYGRQAIALWSKAGLFMAVRRHKFPMPQQTNKGRRAKEYLCFKIKIHKLSLVLSIGYESRLRALCDKFPFISRHTHLRNFNYLYKLFQPKAVWTFAKIWKVLL